MSTDEPPTADSEPPNAPSEAARDAKETGLKALRLIVDEPETAPGSSALKSDRVARIVAEALLGSDGPLVIGVYGKWGHGKTSVLQQALALLAAQPEGNARPLTVWFNAWHYSSYEEPLIPLIAEIASGAAAARASLPLWSRKRRRSLATFIHALGSLGKFAASLKLSILGLAELSTTATDLRKQPLQDVSGYSAAIAAFRDLRNSLGRKLVVFVDDLDRCSPDQALRVLECMKLVFSEPGILFVIGVDPSIIEGYVRKRYQQDYGVQEYGAATESYLDKIVQLAFPLPPHRSHFAAYFTDMVSRYVAPLSTGLSSRLIRAEPLLAKCCRHSPRSLKRLLNATIVDCRYTQMESPASMSENWLALCALSRAMRLYLRDSYRVLVADRWLCEAILQSSESAALRARLKQAPDDDFGPEVRVEVLEDVTGLLPDLPGCDLGRQWLSNHDGRHRVEEYLLAESPQPTAALQEDEDACIRVALAESLGRSIQRLDDEDLSEVRTLRLTYKTLSDHGAAVISRMLNLQELLIEATQVTDAGMQIIASGTRALTRLSVRDTRIDDKALVPIGKLAALRKLDLANTRVTDAGIEALTGLAALEELDLSWMPHITGHCLKFMEGFKNLRKLSFYKTGFSDAVAPLLAAVPTVRELFLGDSPGVADGTLACLAQHRTLQELDLVRTRITDAGVLTLGDMPELMRLSLSGTHISDAVVEKLCQFKSLRQLLVDGTSISSDGALRLRESLPACEVHA